MSNLIPWKLYIVCHGKANQKKEKQRTKKHPVSILFICASSKLNTCWSLNCENIEFNFNVTHTNSRTSPVCSLTHQQYHRIIDKSGSAHDRARNIYFVHKLPAEIIASKFVQANKVKRGKYCKKITVEASERCDRTKVRIKATQMRE